MNFKAKMNVFIVLGGLVAIIVVLLFFIYLRDFSFGRAPQLGVTFSKSYAEYGLKLDWKQTYLAILDDLQVKNVRVVVQWDQVEPEFSKYEFADFDWMLAEAGQRNVDIILAIGRRTPRWPECHDPSWLGALPAEKIASEQKRLVRDLVEHFKPFDSIKMWQVENEPFLTSFGECPAISVDQIKQEVALVKSLDDRPVLITDSGELSSWFKTAHLGDKFGHTLYRQVYNKYVGYFTYVFPPAYYWYKAKMVGLDALDVIVVELQAEPWVTPGHDLVKDAPMFNQSLTPETLQSNVSYATRTGFPEVYLWGVEWWYWLKVNASDPILWNTAKDLIGKK